MHDKNTCFDETDKTSNKIYSDSIIPLIEF